MLLVGLTPRHIGSRPTRALAVTLTSLIFIASTQAAQAGGRVEHVVLVHNGSFSCEGGALTGSGVPGGESAVLKVDSHRDLRADVSLRDGLPDTTYVVRLVQSAGLGGSIADCDVQDATLITDSRGRGHARMHEARLPATIGAFVFLYHLADATGPLDIYGTRLVPVRAVP